MSLERLVRKLEQRIEKIPSFAAKFYDLVPKRILVKTECEIAEKISEKVKEGRILDIGSGAGFLSIELAKRLPKVKVYGIDLSKDMIRISKRYAKGVRNVEFILANASSLPFDNEYFDFIVSTDSLHHWKNPVKVFNECFRVLKRGGEAWIYDGNPDFILRNREYLIKKYGKWHFKLLSMALRFHGFRENEYKTIVEVILNESLFRNSYFMESQDIWMKIVLKKG